MNDKDIQIIATNKCVYAKEDLMLPCPSNKDIPDPKKICNSELIS
jgi:hypothetical protein